MRALIRFLTNLDARAWRTAAVSFLLFGGVGLIFLFGAGALGLKGGGEAVERWLGAGLSGPWALAAAVGGFTALAFLGVPQFVLVAAAVVAFGPWTGFLYSWIGNLVSSVIGFLVGRRFGARLLRNYAGRGVNDFIDMIGRNGFWASLVVRLVPSAPFIVVNMAAGATPMSVWGFVAGTALGSVPKIALTAFAGQAVVKGLNGGGMGHWASLALAAAVWLGSALAARAWLKRREAARLAGAEGARVSERPDYGIDAPKALRGLLIWGSVCGLLGLALAWLSGVPLMELPSLPVMAGRIGAMLGCASLGLLAPAPVMLWSSLAGKFAIRDAVLDAAQLRGGDSVLDVGCGRGLLMVGAARRLTTGRAFGIDLWSAEDLAGNTPEAALYNAALEGVRERVQVETGDARALPWRTGSFDAVVSATALHNIKDAAGRAKALSEMVRVLKPGGRLSLFDIFQPWSYRRTLADLGMVDVSLKGPMLYWLVPGARITARKPG